MSCEQATAKLLRGTGYKLTPQRLMVITVLRHHSGHLTAAEIHRRVTEAYPYVDISTVYRTMQVLKDLRLVTETDLGSADSAFEWAGDDPHHHLVCHSCGGVVRLQHEDMDGVATLLRDKYGFDADIDHFAIFGYCRACVAAGHGRPVRAEHEASSDGV
jgi:Fur family transcriptional regulator, ferric uptake regulator